MWLERERRLLGEQPQQPQQRDGDRAVLVLTQRRGELSEQHAHPLGERAPLQLLQELRVVAQHARPLDELVQHTHRARARARAVQPLPVDEDLEQPRQQPL